MSAQPAAALSIRRLDMAYTKDKPVLRDITLDIAGTGITAIIGPSGTGKSTLVRCINRLVEPSAGEILFEGKDVVKLDRQALRLARRRIGMVFQEYNLVERLTVMENLLCGRLGYVSPWRAMRRQFPPDDIARAYALLDTLVDRFANQTVGPFWPPERRYVDALIADLDHELPNVWGRRVTSVFFGGGTPSLFSADAIDEILAADGPFSSTRSGSHPGCFAVASTNPFRSAFRSPPAGFHSVIVAWAANSPFNTSRSTRCVLFCTTTCQSRG